MKDENKKLFATTLSDVLTRQSFVYSIVDDVQCIPHINLDMEIVFVIEGILNMQVENIEYTIHPFEGIFILPFEKHDFRTYEKSKSCIITFKNKHTKTFFNNVGNSKPNDRLFKIDNILMQYLLNTCSGETSEIYALSILSPLFLCIKKSCTFSGKQTYSDIFLDALTFIGNNFMYDIDEKDVAKEIGVHPSSLSRIFSNTTNMNIKKYINVFRINYSLGELKRNEETISSIAFKSGFSSLRNFNRAFKETMGYTPTEYLKANQLSSSKVKT